MEWIGQEEAGHSGYFNGVGQSDGRGASIISRLRWMEFGQEENWLCEKKLALRGRLISKAGGKGRHSIGFLEYPTTSVNKTCAISS
jgi:hypothetical protein